MTEAKFLLNFIFVLSLLHLVNELHSSKQVFTEGKIVRVLDGDTVIVQTPQGQRERIRLKYIDAPESAQLSFDGDPLGSWVTKRSRKLLLGKTVYFQSYEKDIYGRTLATLYHPSGKDINLELLSQGLVSLGPLYREQPQSIPYSYWRAFFWAYKNREGIFSTSGFLSPWFYRGLLKK